MNSDLAYLSLLITAFLLSVKGHIPETKKKKKECAILLLNSDPFVRLASPSTKISLTLQVFTKLVSFEQEYAWLTHSIKPM